MEPQGHSLTIWGLGIKGPIVHITSCASVQKLSRNLSKCCEEPLRWEAFVFRLFPNVLAEFFEGITGISELLKYHHSMFTALLHHDESHTQKNDPLFRECGVIPGVNVGVCVKLYKLWKVWHLQLGESFEEKKILKKGCTINVLKWKENDGSCCIQSSQYLYTCPPPPPVYE